MLATSLAALALVALDESVAAATRATTTALTLTLAAIARGTRLSKGRSQGVIGVECLRGNHKRVEAERDLLMDQLVPDLVEG
jgi:uncharacterized membrane protein YqjE